MQKYKNCQNVKSKIDYRKEAKKTLNMQELLQLEYSIQTYR